MPRATPAAANCQSTTSIVSTQTFNGTLYRQLYRLLRDIAVPLRSLHLASVTTLNLSGNYLVILGPELFAELVGLESLDVGFNRVEFVKPNAFKRLGHLKELNLSSNFIRKLDEFSFKGLAADVLVDLTKNNVSSEHVHQFRKKAKEYNIRLKI